MSKIDTPNEIYIQAKEFYYDNASIVNGMSLDEFIEVIKSKFDFTDPSYKHKVVQVWGTRYGGDYSDDYEEVDNLEFITYRYETEEERINREIEESIKEEKRIAKDEKNRRERERKSLEWDKKDSIEQIKKYYEIASQFYSKDEINKLIDI